MKKFIYFPQFYQKEVYILVKFVHGRRIYEGFIIGIDSCNCDSERPVFYFIGLHIVAEVVVWHPLVTSHVEGFVLFSYFVYCATFLQLVY